MLVGVGRLVGEERRELVARRRQADQVEVDAPQQRRFVGRRRRASAPCDSCSAARNASIGLRTHAAFLTVGTAGRTGGWYAQWSRGSGGGGSCGRVRAFVDPLLDECDLCVGRAPRLRLPAACACRTRR